MLSPGRYKVANSIVDKKQDSFENWFCASDDCPLHSSSKRFHSD